MARCVYVDGRYVPYAAAQVHVEDRGFQFGDAVYEVCPVEGGRIVDATRHLERLRRSLRELEIREPCTMAALRRVMREVVRRNRIIDGVLYLQVSRGAGRRDFLFPASETRPTVVCIVRSHSRSKLDATAASGIAVRTMPDQRWARVDIKTVQLLAPVLAKEAARRGGAKEAWLVDRDGFVTEGASSNAWILTPDGALVTRPADHAILRGVTRSVVLELVARERLRFEERPFKVTEALAAAEAFVTSASNTVVPVIRIDETVLGSGAPGRFTMKLRALFPSAAEYGA